MKIKKFNRKSILFRVLIPLLLAVCVQAVLLFGVFYFGGVFDTLSQNEVDMLNEKNKSRQASLQNDMINRWGNLDNYFSIVNDVTDKVLKKHPAASLSDLHAVFYDEEYGRSYPLYEIILREQCNELIYFMQRSAVSGAFVILNNDVSGDKSGIFLKTNSVSGSSITDLMVRVASPHSMQIFESQKITKSNMDSHFKIAGDSDDSAFFFAPLQLAAQELEKKSGEYTSIRNYGYWSRPFYINGKGDKSITYTVPLILGKKVYGIIGVELTTNLLKSQMSFSEIAADNSGSYILAVDKGNDLSFEVVTATGAIFTKAYGGSNNEIIAKTDPEHEENYIFLSHGNSNEYCGSIQSIEIYNTFSPFAEDNWVLIALIERSTLYAFSDRFLSFFMIIVSITLLIGILCSLTASIAVSAPVSNLTESIKKKEIDKLINLGRCNIYEIDELVGAIEQLGAKVSELERIDKIKIEFERDHDVLTKLKNRRAFKAHLKYLTNNPENIKIAALIMIDLDGLKSVNDTYGHILGDEYIKETGRGLQIFENDKSIAARLGGDEFVLLFYGYDKKEDIYEIVERFKHEMKGRSIMLPNGKTYNISFSAGLAWYPDDAADFTTLLKNADSAMYSVKHSGKGEIVEYNITHENMQLDN